MQDGHTPRSTNAIYRIDVAVIVENSLGNCSAIEMRGARSGAIHVPAGISATLLTPHACSTANGIYLPLYDEDGVALAIAVSASRAYELPVACRGVVFMKLLSNNSGNETIHLTLKS